MDKKNCLSTYTDGNGNGNGNGSSPSRNNRGASSNSNSASKRAGGNTTTKNAGVKAGDTDGIDAVANYSNYKQNLPSNPRNSPPRASRGGANTNDVNKSFNKDGNGRFRDGRWEEEVEDNDHDNNRRHESFVKRREYPSEPSSAVRSHPWQRQQQQQQHPRLAYYNEGPATTKNKANPNKNRAASRPMTNTRNGDPSDQQQKRRPYHSYASADNRHLVDSRPQSARGQGPPRTAASPAYYTTPASAQDHNGLSNKSDNDTDSFDDYVSPSKARDGYYHVADEDEPPSASRRSRGGDNSNSAGRSQRSSAAAAAVHTGPAEFLVRVHCIRDAFSDFEEDGRAAPTSYVSVHTTVERGRTGIASSEMNPVFNDEFLFTSSRPEKDAVVVTLVAVPAMGQHPTRRQSTVRDKRVAQAVISLQNLQPRVERAQWVTLVRHPGTDAAYERGEVLVSILSHDYGQRAVPTEEEEAAYYDEIHDLLVESAPEELHRLDWLVGSVAKEGPEGLTRLRARIVARSIEPAKVRLTLRAVSGLTSVDGAPAAEAAASCYCVISTAKGTEMTTKTVAYRKQAVFDQTFVVTLRNPQVDGVTITVYSADRKVAETMVGLTNLKAGVSKDVTLMLVRAAETGDAAAGGEVSLTLQTDGYTSPHQMSAGREGRLRERLLSYLWCYLRDDLHRLDVIVAGIDEDEDAYMSEWSHAIGPEKSPKHASIRVRRISDVFGDDKAAATAIAGRVGSSIRCYVRVVVGPQVHRTELSSVRNGELAFQTPIDLTLYNAKTDSIECMVIEDCGGSAEREVSRVVLSTAGLPRGDTVVRTVKLVAAAATRAAKTQGAMEVELIAHDFGPRREALLPDDQYAYLSERLEASARRSKPGALHRVPFMVDGADRRNPRQDIEQKIAEMTHGGGGGAPAAGAAGNGGRGSAERDRSRATSRGGGGGGATPAATVTSAPMTLQVIGLRGFRATGTGVYVKAYLNSAVVLKTADKTVPGPAQVSFDISDDNEATVKLVDAMQSSLTFKVGKHYRSCKSATVLALSELALRNMIRGEKNIVWIPLFAGSADADSTSTNSNKDVFTGNRLSSSPARASSAAAAAAPLGELGVMVRSNAFPGNTVTEYTITGAGRDGEKLSALEAVTQDVATLLTKYAPEDLPKVQPLIAECTSLKEAHREIRAQVCPRPIGATVYVCIEKVELNTADGRVQERLGGITAEVSFGAERQYSQRRSTAAGAGASKGASSGEGGAYSIARLDIVEDRGESHGSGGGGRSRPVAGSRKEVTTVAAPPLVIKLIGTRPGAAAPRAVNTGIASGDGGYGEVSGQGRGDSATGRRTSLGGRNNIINYLDAKGNSGSRQVTTTVNDDTAAADSPYAYHSKRRGRSNDISNNKTNANGIGNGGGGESSFFSRNNAAAAAHQGELGLVHLSLRALLSSPLHKVGDTFRVPILCPPAVTPYGQTADTHGGRAAAERARCIVGHVTFRLTLPAFETNVPEWLRLSSRHVLSEVEPGYVHYFERRIGAYMRECTPSMLHSFHYKLYERDVATGLWPVSLQDWLLALVKRFGTERPNTFGREPPLRFDPEERAFLRNADAGEALLRESQFVDSEAAYSPADWLGDEIDADTGGGGGGGAHGNDGQLEIYEVTPSSKRRGNKTNNGSQSRPRQHQDPHSSGSCAHRSGPRDRSRPSREQQQPQQDPEATYGF